MLEFIHARLRAAVNISNLPEDTFSFSTFCAQWDCQPGNCSKSCAVYDDQFAIIPKGLSDAYFGFHNVSEAIAIPESCEWTKSGMVEGALTRAVLSRGGQWKPLTYSIRIFMHGLIIYFYYFYNNNNNNCCLNSLFQRISLGTNE